jgi:hypothetical protein
MHASMNITKKMLTTVPLRCANCGQEMDSPKLYCEQLCRQEAAWVRYARACNSDGRIDDPEVWEALQIQLAHIISGGYDKRGRTLSKETRARIFQRDNGKCQKCGAPGRDIDHISGGSNDESNLQLLCRPCHNEKTRANMVPIPEAERAEKAEHQARLFKRALAKRPLQFCDSPEWDDEWRSVGVRRRKIFKERRA